MEHSKKQLTDRFIKLVEEMYLGMRSRPPEGWTEIELTIAQMRTLLLLRQGPQRMSDIASYLGSTLSSATSMVDRLVGKRLVERAHDANDRRLVICRLTSSGEADVERFWRIGRSKIEEMAEALSLQELETVVNALRILSAAIKRQSKAAPAALQRDI